MKKRNGTGSKLRMSALKEEDLGAQGLLLYPAAK